MIGPPACASLVHNDRISKGGNPERSVSGRPPVLSATKRFGVALYSSSPDSWLLPDRVAMLAQEAGGISEIAEIGQEAKTMRQRIEGDSEFEKPLL